MMEIKEEDIRPTYLFEEYLKISAKDTEEFFAKSLRSNVNCPACGKKEKKFEFNKLGFEYVTCIKCKTLYLSPRPEMKYFEKFYKESKSSEYWTKVFFPAVADVRRKKLFKPKALEIQKLCKKDSFKPLTIADVGAGYGILLEEIRSVFDYETKLIAIEPNPEMASICLKKGLVVDQNFVEDANSIHGQIDLVISLEVLEHTFNPLNFCKSLYKLLKPGGRVLITTLNVNGFDIQVLWEESKSISPPHHINLISTEGFLYLMKRVGFKNIEIFTPGKLDVDIVKKFLNNNDRELSKDRFISILLKQDNKALFEFQDFLANNQMSSHCWIWASK